MHISLRKTLLALAAVTLFCLNSRAEIPAMIILSSHSYDVGDDRAKAVAVDADDNVFVTGLSDGKYFSVKYNKNLLPVQTTDYYSGIGGDNPKGIAVSGSNILVVGEVPNGSDQDWFVARYTPDFQGTLSTTVFDGGAYDGANAVVIDNLNNVVVSGYTNDGATDNIYIVKYDMNLAIISSVTYDSGNNEVSYAVAANASNEIFVGGSQDDGSSQNYLVLKYDSNLNFSNFTVFKTDYDEKISAITIDAEGNVIVAGRQYDGSTQNYLVVKYDKNLNFISSATYDSGANDIATGVALDSNGNIVVSGYTLNNYNVIKYNPDFVLISSATYDGGYTDILNGVAINSEDNIIVTGQSSDGSTNNYFTIKYNGSPSISSVDPLYQGETNNIQINGKCFYDSSVSFDNPGISTNSVNIISASKISANVTVSPSIPIGVANMTVTNANGEYIKDITYSEVHARKTISPSSDEVVTARAVAGVHSITIGAGTFPVSETITVSAREPVSGDTRQIGQGIYLANDPVNDPAREMMIKLYYRDEDLNGYDEGRLRLAYYEGSEYITLVSAVNAVENSVTAAAQVINKKFAIVKAGQSAPPSLDTSIVIVFPNPYKPGSGGDFDDSSYGKGIVFSGLSGKFKLTILSVAGELVFSKTVYADSYKRYIWNTKSDNGVEAASGVYIYAIEDAEGLSDTLTGKLSIVR